MGKFLIKVEAKYYQAKRCLAGIQTIKGFSMSLSDLVDRSERKPFLGQFFDYLRQIARLFNENNRENEQKWLFRSRFILSPTGS
jgi:hypothetical protein